MNAYYRTGKGSHRHASWYCANGRRAIDTGDVIECTATEAAEMAPCQHCTDEAEIVAHIETVVAEVAAKPAKCDGRPANPKFIKSQCKECAHVGTSRSWRAHTPK
jgi:hypothetical protein